MQPNPQGYNVTTETVSYPGNGGSADGFLARPNDGQQHPGVILVQEWWGLEPHIKDLAQQIANEGYIVLTPTSITARWWPSGTRRRRRR